jgi:hypothetical protein
LIKRSDICENAAEALKKLGGSRALEPLYGASKGRNIEPKGAQEDPYIN